MAVYPHDHRMWALIGLYGGRGDNTFGAIHIYGGDFFGVPRSDWDPDTLQERPYDIERARKLMADANERWAAECAKAGGG